MKRIAAGLVFLLWVTQSLAAASPAVAFFYGEKPPREVLRAFDLVVVDPDHVPQPDALALAPARIAAYVAVGEVQASRPYFKELPAAWLRGDNPAWGSRVIDQGAPGWPAFLVDRLIAPLWAAGYRDFFLDTLDSWQLIANTAEERARQEAGLIAAIRAIKARFPDARLIFNRGFEILPAVHDAAWAVAAESLFAGHDATKKAFRPVAAADRDWLLGQLRRVRDEYHLPVIVIDYLPAGAREQMRATAQKIAAEGFIPWVATPDLATVGIGAIEALPRRILAVHGAQADEYAVSLHPVIRHLAMPLNHLGYTVETVDVRHLPDLPLAGRYAGIVVWTTRPPAAALQKTLAAWLEQQQAAGLPIILLGDFPYAFDGRLGAALGLASGPAGLTATAHRQASRIERQGPLVGREWQPGVHPAEFTATTLVEGRVQLALGQGRAEQVAVAITPWGGFAMNPHVVATLAGTGDERWVLDPFGFFKAALRLPDMPVPDVTTESGRRLWLTHMDGDGYPSRAELPGNPYAAEVILERVVKRYRVPMTSSVIESEIAPHGLHPAASSTLEKVAREIFAQPHVEIASHSYSHPFRWGQAAATAKVAADANDDANAEAANEGYALAIAGYTYDARREIEGSVRYIDTRLAPPGKKTRVFLWTGDCNPGREELAITRALGLYNMNGGDTTITTSQPTLTAVAPFGRLHGDILQVFAPNQNENVYTNNWSGPFYGYRRVIETFRLTDAPRRLKPINIYFHTYIATKHAGMKSLDEVFAWAMTQETMPLFVSDYAQKVLDFSDLAIARTANGWRIRGAGSLRQLRLDGQAGGEAGWPDLAASRNVAGVAQHNGSRYVHMSADTADLVLASRPPETPYLVSANGAISDHVRNGDLQRWHIDARVPLAFTLANAGRCVVRADGRVLRPQRVAGNLAHYQLTRHAARPLETLCRP